MNGQEHTFWFRAVLLLSTTVLLDTGSALAQTYTFDRCISSAEVPSRVLAAPYAITLWRSPPSQSLQTCANFCAHATVPPEAEARGDRSQFNAPYTFTMLNTGWCFCGNTINGTEVPASQCQRQQECLPNPAERCQRPQEEGYMIYRVGGGGQASGGAAAQPPPPVPPPTFANRPPNAPTVPAGGYEPPFPLQYEGAIQLTWQNNGDPDGDPLTFGVFIMEYDRSANAWVPVSSFRDEYGNTGAVWMSDTVFTFTTQAGLRAATYYAWIVIAREANRGPTQQCVWSGWSVFRTQ